MLASEAKPGVLVRHKFSGTDQEEWLILDNAPRANYVWLQHPETGEIRQDQIADCRYLEFIRDDYRATTSILHMGKQVPVKDISGVWALAHVSSAWHILTPNAEGSWVRVFEAKSITAGKQAVTMLALQFPSFSAADKAAHLPMFRVALDYMTDYERSRHAKAIEHADALEAKRAA